MQLTICINNKVIAAVKHAWFNLQLEFHIPYIPICKVNMVLFTGN